MDAHRIYVPLQGGGVRALARETGATVWSQAVITTRPPAVGDGMLVVARSDALAAYDAATGDETWTALPGVTLSAPPAWTGDRFVVSTAAAEIIALRPADGEILWQRRLGSPTQHLPALLDETAIVMTLDDGRVVALKGQTGEPVWERRLEGALSAPATARDRVFVGSTNNYFYALDGDTGNRAWRWRTGGDVVGAAATDDRVYFASLDNLLRAVNRGNGNQQWKAAMQTRPSAPPMVVGDVVLVAGVAPRLSGYAGKTGAALEGYTAPADLQGVPLVDAVLRPFRVAIVALMRDGRVEALRPRSMLFPDPPLVPFGTLPGRELPPERLFSTPDSQFPTHK